ncbi:MAG: hypothetical protein ACO29Q_08845 [Crocinitomicaceae bacterium]
MKFLLLSLCLYVTLPTFSQSQWEIELSHDSPVPRMGKWVRGDYTIVISLDTLSMHFRRCEQSITRSLEYYKDQDSNLANYFRATQNRYSRAATLLEQGENGFDLNTLIIYEGIENPNRNLEDSRILESYLKQRVEQGKDLVFYKGKRIFTLCRSSEHTNQGRMETASDILNSGYVTKTFYYEPDNSLFVEYYFMGW